MSIELCFVCGCATGRAGKAEDSLYNEDNGPFCEKCHEDAMMEIESNEKALHDERQRWTATDRPHGHLDKGGFSHG